MEFFKVYSNAVVAAVSISAVRNCFTEFHTGELKLDEKPRCVKPKEMEDEELTKDMTQPTRQLAIHLNMAHFTVHMPLKATGRVVKVGRWIPRVLSGRNVAQRL